MTFHSFLCFLLRAASRSRLAILDSNFKFPGRIEVHQNMVAVANLAAPKSCAPLAFQFRAGSPVSTDGRRRLDRSRCGPECPRARSVNSNSICRSASRLRSPFNWISTISFRCSSDKRVEHDDLVHPIQKLRPEMVPQLFRAPLLSSGRSPRPRKRPDTPGFDGCRYWTS